MKEKKDILRYLKEEAEKIEIPESITPEQMRKKLETIEKFESEVRGDKSTIQSNNVKKEVNRKKNFQRKRYHLPVYIVTAACLCLLVGTAYTQKNHIIKFWEGEIKTKTIYN